jgi:tripartite motif-containing protein 71
MRQRWHEGRAVGLAMRRATVLFMTLWCGSAGAECWYLDQQWPTEGSPACVAVDAAGYVYATCQNTAAGVQKYNTDGKLAAQWGPRGSDAGQLLTPQGIAVDKAGNVYVADTGNRRIQKFSGDGKFIRQWRTFARGKVHTFRPFGVATELSGQYVYVTDDANSRVLKFTTNGFAVREWGGYGTDNRQFIAPRCIITDSLGFVYVVDNAANCVKKFSHLGVFENVWGGADSQNSCFVSPVGITVDYSGYLWITDRSHRVQQFWQPVRRKGWFGGCNNPEHREAGCWHEFTTDHRPAGGASAGQFTDPRGVAVDPAGNLYVADFANRRIQKLASLETAKPGTSGLPRLSWSGVP